MNHDERAELIVFRAFERFSARSWELRFRWISRAGHSLSAKTICY